MVCLLCLVSIASVLVGVASVVGFSDDEDFSTETSGADDHRPSITLHAEDMTNRRNIVDVPQMVCVRGCEQNDSPLKGFKWVRCFAVIPEDYDGRYTAPRSWQCEFPVQATPGFCVDSYTVDCEHQPYYSQWYMEDVMRDLQRLCAVRYSVVEAEYCVRG